MSADTWTKNRINENTNLNDFILPGTYICQTYSIAQTLLNSPYKDGNFKLFVIQNTGNNTTGYRWLSQTIISARSQIFHRGFDNNTGFEDWKCLTDDYSSKYLNTIGYIVFNNGLIFQWGNTNILPNKTSVDVVLPIRPVSGWIRQVFLTQNGTAFNNSLCYLDTVFDKGSGTFCVGHNSVNEYSEWFSYFIIWC